MKKHTLTVYHTLSGLRIGSVAPEPAAAASLGISLYDLMQRAGQAAYALARNAYPSRDHWLVLCGHGNNGGDGYVVARLAKAAGLQVTLIACEGARPLPPEAAAARQAGWPPAVIFCRRTAAGRRPSLSLSTAC